MEHQTYAWGPRPAQRPSRTVIKSRYLAGGTVFHVTMSVVTGGAWVLVLPFFLRTRKTTITRER